MSKNKEKEKTNKKINVKNRKASFEYHFYEQLEAGIVLTGSEIKSIREGKVNLQEAFCVIQATEIFIKNMHISPYEKSYHYNHEPKRQRKLLLNKKEIIKLKSKSQEKGFTIIPTRLFINDRGIAKVTIALAKGKKLYDKREDIKQKDLQRETGKNIKF